MTLRQWEIIREDLQRSQDFQTWRVAINAAVTELLDEMVEQKRREVNETPVPRQILSVNDQDT